MTDSSPRQPSASEPDPKSAALPEGQAAPAGDATSTSLSTIKIPLRYAKSKLKKPKKPKLKWQMPFARFFFGKSESLRFVLVAFWISLFVSSFFALHVINFNSRNDADRLTWDALPFWKPLEAAEYNFYDQRFSSRGIRTPLSHNKIVIVALDQFSLNQFGQWPIPRTYYAQLVDRLKKAGAKVIVLDFDFSDYRNPKFDAAKNVILSDEDRELAKSLARAKNVILPTYLVFDRKANSTGKKDEDVGEATKINFVLTPIDEFDTKTPDLSLGFVPVDSDGGVRRYPWEAVINPGGDSTQANVGSLAGLAVALYKNQVTDQENNAYQLALKTAQVVTADKTVHEVPLESGKPANKTAPVISTMLLNYWGPETFPTYAFSDIVRSRSTTYSDDNLKRIFGGRIVFVGPTAQILKDVFPMPHFRLMSLSGVEIEESRISGVELHATAAAMLMDGAFVTPPSTRVTLICVFGLTLFAGLLMGGLRGYINRTARSVSQWWIDRGGKKRLHDPVWLALYVLVGMTPAALYWYATSWAFMQYHMWLVAVYPGLSSVIASSSVLLYSFAVETGERRKALAQFSKLVSPEVMEEILSHPEGESAAARRVTATVLFSDLEGFTSFSEVHEPEEVIEAINALFSRLEPVVHAYGGTLDKYIGDAIMAFFGAPVPRFDHAARALHCAIAMQNECVLFRRETGIPFYMRVGVHTGEVIVGSVGSETRSDYTMIGDTVNLASRLESKNKEFGSYVMCSSATFQAAPGVAIVESASAQIKGKSQNVDVYIVRGLMGQPAIDSEWCSALGGDGQTESTLPQQSDSGNDISAAFENEAMKALPEAGMPMLPSDLQPTNGAGVADLSNAETK